MGEQRKGGLPQVQLLIYPPVLRTWFSPWSRKNPHGAGQLTPCATTIEHSVQSTYCNSEKGTAVEAHTGAEREEPPPLSQRKLAHSSEGLAQPERE